MYALLSLALALTIAWVGCNEKYQSPSAPEELQENLLDESNPQVQAVIEVQNRNTPSLMEIAGVVGTATGLDENGKPTILILTETDIMATALAKGDRLPLPDQIDGVPVTVEVTGRIVALKGGGGGVSHTAKQTPPIQLGTSGGWRHDLANGFCCGGTLGSLVQRAGNQYILSNYHVLEADIVNGGNGRTAQAGDPVIQPGLIDVGCNAANAQDVATLSGIKSLPSSNVDAAVARVIPGMVRTDGAILEIGTLSASTIGASINQNVKKSGRTTGLTRSRVSGLNATVSVAYDNECAGGAAFTKTFTGQILVRNRGSSFLNSGDSGSLMVQNVTTRPRAVGLLFAGSSSIAVANPINQVLSFFGASMVGN
jgi:hypothetical protein